MSKRNKTRETITIKKEDLPKRRNPASLMPLLMHAGGRHKHKKKEASRLACRRKNWRKDHG